MHNLTWHYNSKREDTDKEVTDSAITPTDINATSRRALSWHATGNNEYDIVPSMKDGQGESVAHE